MTRKFILKDFIIITLLTSIWIHAYQLLRFFGYVKPALHDFLPTVPHLAAMNKISILLIWGAWDMVLTALYVFLFWLCAQVFGNTHKAILTTALTSWCLLYVLFWTGLANMNLINWGVVGIVLPMTLIETSVASLIASTLYQKKAF